MDRRGEDSLEIALHTAHVQPTAVRRRVMRFFQSAADERSDLEAAELIVGELLGNVVRHAPGPFRIRAGWTGSEATFVVEDSGGGFSLPMPSAPANQETGRGLRLVLAFARSLNVQHVAGRGTRIEVGLPLERGP